MDQDIIRAVQDAGFQVYMRDPKDTYLYFTDGISIGYLQNNHMDGTSIRTVHVANKTTGTGFYIADRLEKLTEKTLRRAFVIAPREASYREVNSVHKFRNMKAFRNLCEWNKLLQLVEKSDDQAR